MYGYGESVFSVGDILARVPQEEIYEFIVGYKPVPYSYTTSPLREDRKPGAFYEWFNGRLYFVDFADPERVNRDCFQVMMDMQGISLKEASRRIIEHFDLRSKPVIFPNIGKVLKSKKASNRDIVSHHERLHTEITFKCRNFDNRDRLYWNLRYGISKSELIEDNVFPIIWYKFYSEKKGEWIIIRPDDICYAYSINGRVKIYRPLAKSHRGKWITNCDGNDIGGLPTLPEHGTQLLFQKAYKDSRVIRNFGATSVWNQNEAMIPSTDVLIPLCKRFDEVVFWYDNDETGIKGSKKMADLVNQHLPGKARSLWLPESYPKDPSDMMERGLKGELTSFLIESDITCYGNITNCNPRLMEAPFDTTLSE